MDCNKVMQLLESIAAFTADAMDALGNGDSTTLLEYLDHMDHEIKRIIKEVEG